MVKSLADRRLGHFAPIMGAARPHGRLGKYSKQRLNDFCQLCSHFVNGMVLTIGKFLGVAALLAATLPKLFTQWIAVATFSPFLGTAWQLSVPGDLPRAWPAPKAACRRISRPPRYRYARPRRPPRRGSRSGVAPLSRLPQMPTVLAEGGRSPTASLQATHAQR